MGVPGFAGVMADHATAFGRIEVRDSSHDRILAKQAREMGRGRKAIGVRAAAAEQADLGVEITSDNYHFVDLAEVEMRLNGPRLRVTRNLIAPLVCTSHGI